MSDNDEDSNKRRRILPSSILLEYPFFMPLVRTYLTDADVLTKLLITGKSMKPSLDNWPFLQALSVKDARHITCWGRYANVIVKHIIGYNGEDLARQTALESLTTRLEFNSPFIAGDLPLSLIGLHLREMFNQPIPPGVLPPGLNILYVGDSFNQPIHSDSLPVMLKDLHPGNSFDQPIAPRTIPDSATALYIGNTFNRPLQPSSLPLCLKRLTFGRRFNQSLSATIIPPALEYLEFRSKSRFSNTLFLPQTLRDLRMIRRLSDLQISRPWSTSLVHLSLGLDTEPLPVGLLPASLRNLTVEQPVLVGSIPVVVKELRYQVDCPIPAGAIPNTVTTLDFFQNYNQQVLPGVIPDSVTHLIFGGDFNQFLLPRSIPSSVTHIGFGRSFNQLLVPGVLPESILCLYMHRMEGVFNQLLLTVDAPTPSFSMPLTMGSIPRSVTHLVLSRDYNQPLLPGAIPPSVTHLALGNKFAQPLSSDNLPDSISQLIVATGGVVYASDDVVADVKEDDTDECLD